MPSKPTCLVAQGFGEKTDLATGRRLNLDASYQMIRSVVERSGYQCVRADEIVGSGTIDIDGPLYEALWRSDLVIVDLSTSNLNAAYELGVRHALRPNNTIVVAENGNLSWVDVDWLSILSYRHDGSGIEPTEAERFQTALKARIDSVRTAAQPDSPPYVALSLKPSPQPMTAPGPVAPLAPADVAPAAASPKDERTAKSLLDRGREAMDLANYWAAKIFLRTLCARRPHDESLAQLLAEATYRARLPDRRTALEEARKRLAQLNPAVSNNPETLRLWGTVHRRLWEDQKNSADLQEAVTAFERAFHATRKHDFAGELAYLLNLRAEVAVQTGERMEAIADFVLARRMRRAAKDLAKEAALKAPPGGQSYWLQAAIWEAAVGIGDSVTADDWRKKAEAWLSPWRIRVSLARISRIEQFLASSPLRGQGQPAAPQKTSPQT